LATCAVHYKRVIKKRILYHHALKVWWFFYANCCTSSLNFFLDRTKSIICSTIFFSLSGSSSIRRTLSNRDLSFISGISGSAVVNTHGVTSSQFNTAGSFTPDVTSFLNNQTTNTTNGKPKAFINWIFFDEQFNIVPSASGFEQVGNDTEFKLHVKQPVATKCGFLYVYVSNETPNIPVYFDNLQVSHVRSPLLETNENYSFGLKMESISYRASMTMVNRFGWNGGNEYEDEGELNYSNTFYRKYDAQIGRFTGVDMRAEEFADVNPYQFGLNNPVMFNDPMGDLSQAAWNDFLSRLGSGNNLNGFGDYGGSYSGNSGFNAFRSEGEAFSAGASYMDKHNAWGTYGFANSFEGAKDSYYAHGGTDARIRSLYPNITIYGGIKNGQWQTRNTVYSGFGGGAIWPTIGPVISKTDFVGWGYPGVTPNCFDYCRAQIRKVGFGLRSPGYWNPKKAGVINDGIYQVYSKKGPNVNQLNSGISYTITALQNNIPVVVGVDDQAGSPNADKITDHFVVIVGMGTDAVGNYFQFYDNASGNVSQGANDQNRLYFLSVQNIITGSSQTTYAQNSSYNYIVTQIRESKK
jgi:RHS repeat-associated protein